MLTGLLSPFFSTVSHHFSRSTTIMAFLTRRTSLVGLYNRHRPIPPLTPQSNSFNATAYFLLLCLNPNRSRNQWLSTGAESNPSELAGKNAYELLGVSETSSFAEIKASFRKLAKETHPDLAQTHNHSSASDQFVRILAAYEVLSIVWSKVIVFGVF